MKKDVRRIGLTVVIAIILMNLCNLAAISSFALKDMACVALGITIGDVVCWLLTTPKGGGFLS